MARDPLAARIDRTQAAPTAASDMSVYGATPIALGAPAIAMALGGAPAIAESGTPPPIAGPGASSIAQPTTITGNDSNGGGSPLEAALITPVVLADAAIVGMAALVAGQPAATETTPAEPTPEMPVASGGSGTPPGLLIPPAPAIGIIDETPDRPNPVGADLPVAGLPGTMQSPQANIDAAMDAVSQRIEAIDEMVADIGDRVDAIGSELKDKAGETIDTVVSSLDDRVAVIDTQIAGLAQGVTGALTDIDLGPVGGSDPAGGITTLVGMVSAADMFGLPDIGSGADAFTLPALGSAGGDLLGDFAPADILLTIPDTHDSAFGLLAGLVDDHSG